MKWIKHILFVPSIVVLMSLISICVCLYSYYSVPRVRVSGYYRKSGVYVRPYSRRYPGQRQSNISEQTKGFLWCLRFLKGSLFAYWLYSIIHEERKENYVDNSTPGESGLVAIFMFIAPILVLL